MLNCSVPLHVRMRCRADNTQISKHNIHKNTNTKIQNTQVQRSVKLQGSVALHVRMRRRANKNLLNERKPELQLKVVNSGENERRRRRGNGTFLLRSFDLKNTIAHHLRSAPTSLDVIMLSFHKIFAGMVK